MTNLDIESDSFCNSKPVWPLPYLRLAYTLYGLDRVAQLQVCANHESTRQEKVVRGDLLIVHFTPFISTVSPSSHGESL